MPRSLWQKLFNALTILATLVVLLAYATQTANIQIIFIQPVYWSLDPTWGEIRTIALLLVSCAGAAVLIFQDRAGPQKGWNPGDRWVVTLRMIGIILDGLILGLLVFYAHSCCDSPVLFYFGFPLSWLRGAAPDFHYLPLPIVPYLLQNLARIGWYVDGFSLLVDALFWGDAAILIFAIQTQIQTAQSLKTGASIKSEK